MTLAIVKTMHTEDNMEVYSTGSLLSANQLWTLIARKIRWQLLINMPDYSWSDDYYSQRKELIEALAQLQYCFRAQNDNWHLHSFPN